MCVCESERECVCVSEREVCVCEREREWCGVWCCVRESVCVCVW